MAIGYQSKNKTNKQKNFNQFVLMKIGLTGKHCMLE